MPKKFKKTTYAKPASTAHHTLVSGGSRYKENDRLRPSPASPATEQQPSVNELINHLRRTQVSRPADQGSENPYRFVAPRSVHPSLRNLLELPETPPPRPRPDSRRHAVGARRMRRTAGPPPPQSWLVGNYNSDSREDEVLDQDSAIESRIIYRLERLPGTTFPTKGSLQHTVLKSMALYWGWHLEYDGPFLGELPNHIKVRLLSYISIYARDQIPAGLGLRPLFTSPHQADDAVHDPNSEITHANDGEVTRLDLGSALGRRLTLKQVSSELLVTTKRPNVAQQTPKEAVVPASWEDEYEEQQTPPALTTATLRTPRFENLRYLSLAHPTHGSANWNSLITLLSRLSRITHLSLAHWPLPTVTPHALNATVRHPTQRSLTFAYGGTDSYAASENNWAESAGILRRLSRATYCLKWLDLEGCGEWIPALNWVGVGPDGETYATGPEWNGSWRDIDWIRLGPGWFPLVDSDDNADDGTRRLASTVQQQATNDLRPEDLGGLRSLASSMHAPTDGSEPTDLPWDVEEERIKYRRSKELQRYRQTITSAKEVQLGIQRVRKQAKGKWMRFSFGLEGLQDDALKRLLGEQWLSLLP